MTRSSKLTRPLLWAFAVAALVGALAPVAAARPPRDFVGIVSDDLLHADRGYRVDSLRQQSELRIGVLRQNFHWAQIETAPGEYDFSIYDRLVLDAAAKGIRVLPILTDAPDFRSSKPAEGARRGFYPPANNADLGIFGARLVERYGPNGSLWRERPDVRKLPIRAWQIWNEPNLPVYWPTGTGPRGYVRLLRAASVAIKRADRGAEIVAAGLPNSRQGTHTLERYVSEMYRWKAKSAFDTLAIHPYSKAYLGVVNKVRTIRRIMNRRGDRRAKIWITEYGWSDVGPRSTFRAGSIGQARQIQAVLVQFGKLRRSLGIRGAVLYNWRDGSIIRSDFWGLHTGLLRKDGSRKPSFYSFRQAIRALP